jgi:hypothetical protein
MTLPFATLFGSIAAALLLIDISALAQSQDSLAPAEDPPGRVGRLSFIEGAVRQRSAGDTDWAGAQLNYPVTNGFALATDEGGRAEIQMGSMALRIGSDSELDVATLTDHRATLTVARGEINLRLDRAAAGDQIEIVTPRGIANVVSVGHYHFDAGSTERPTRVGVFDGRVEIPRDGGPTVLTGGQSALIKSDEKSDEAPGLTLTASARGPLDDWAIARDEGATRTAVASTVSPEMTGADDLDQHGTWRRDPRYGEIWYPSGVPPDWVPYRYGHWAWVPPWGWTWVDDAPWGFAPFHYGRWVYTAYGWAWVPGSYVDYPVYAPALVGFVGSPFFGGFGPAVRWFPLAPFEVFVPAFPCSIVFVRRINVTNVNITKINITRVNGNVVVNNTTHVTINQFANRQFNTVVSTTSFTSGQAVHRTMLAQSATRLAVTTPVSFSPANLTAPHSVTAAWRGTDATAKPPLPPANGGVAIAATSGRTAGATGGITTATRGSDPKHGQHSLPPLPGSGPVAHTPMAGPVNWRSTDLAGASTTAAVRKLPPLPSEPSRATAAARVDAGAAAQHVPPVPSAPLIAARPIFNPNRAGPSQPGTMTPSMHAPMTSPARSRPPNMGTMMPGGPSMRTVPRPASPSLQSRGFAQPPSRPPNMATMMPRGPSVRAVPRPASPSKESTELVQRGGG